jgi:hypothetical protein
MRFWGVLVFCALALTATRGEAQPSVTDLRARLAAAEAARPEAIPRGSLTSIGYLIDVSERIEARFETQSGEWRSRADRYLDAVEAGRDPYPEQRGVITNRGYDSPMSTIRQGYAVYVPPDYDPSRRYPLLVMLHGGSSNGNLFLGVVLGNNMDWLTYSRHLWDEYTPRWSPDWIIVAPDGFGQVLWRWMGEADVLQVIDDVSAHYSVDSERVVLNGLSNGGVGSYSLGMRHASRFSLVLAMAGAPSWLQYTGGSPTAEERTAMLTYSGMHLVESSLDTDFRFFHGTQDPGPMRPAFVREMEAHMREIGLEPHVQWFEMGHDLLYVVHRHGRAYDGWAQVTRNRRREDVRVVTGDYRAAEQHWVRVTRIVDFPRLARVEAHAADGVITVTTERASEIALDLRDAPIGTGDTLRVVVDGTEAYAGPRAPLAHVLHLARIEDRWQPGFLATEGLAKVPGLSGPLTDPYPDGMIHVYGTQDPEATDELRHAAERGSHGWPVWLWNLQQPVVADTDVTDEMMRDHHLVLYGTPGANSVLERMWPELPITVAADGVHVGETVHHDAGVGVRFVYPNPLVHGRYVIVQASPTTAGVDHGNNLPDFLPDYFVYDAAGTRSRPRLISGRSAVAMGYFDDAWQLRSELARSDRTDVLDVPYLGGDDGPRTDVVLVQESVVDAGLTTVPDETDEQREARLALNAILGMGDDYVLPPDVLLQTPTVTIPYFTPVPDVPAIPRRWGAPRTDPAGVIARRIARRVATFPNFRAIIPGGEWRSSRGARWSFRPEAECLAALDAAEIAYTRVPDLDSTVAHPIRIDGPVGGVTFVMSRPEESVVVSCEMAARLPVLARIMRAHEVRQVTVLSAFRTRPRTSFHTMGLALDMASFETDDGGSLSVLDSFVETPDARTCDAPRPHDPAARSLLAIACELADSHSFSSVLTPNYNDGHRNHFHVDIRPDDPRVFVR